MDDEDEKYRIENGYIQPPPHYKAAPPLRELEVGQSIIFEKERRASVATLAWREAKKTGKKFTIRKINKQEIRIWRTN